MDDGPMTLDLGQLAGRVADKLASRPSRSAGPPRKGGTPLSTNGIAKRGRVYRVDTTVSGHRVFRSGFPSIAAAAEWADGIRRDPQKLIAYLRERDEGGTETVAEVLSWYQRSHCTALRSADRCQQLAAHLSRLIGDLRIGRVRQEHVDDYKHRRLAEGGTAKGIFNELSQLRAAMNYAWRNDRLQQQPRFRLSKPHSARKRVAWEDEAAALIGAAELPLRRVIAACWTVGLRRTEVIEMRWSWVVAPGEVLLPSWATKTGTEERVLFGPQLWESLTSEPPRHPEFVFCYLRNGRNGRRKHMPPEIVRWTKTTLRRRWKDLCKEVGATGLVLHDLRRSMSSVGQSRGHSRAAVQANGRWSSPKVMDLHYSHAQAGAARAVSADLEQLLIGNGQADQQPPESGELLELLRTLTQQLKEGAQGAQTQTHRVGKGGEAMASKLAN